ncbi:MAG: NAD-dependent epimerase/dehydratase family protein [Phenylobacterium sp.]
MILVTGSAGFIGFHAAQALLDRGETVIGLDCISPYYDPRLKLARLGLLEQRAGYRHFRVDLSDREATARVFEEIQPTGVVHLAAQPGVRYSLEHPEAYVDSNLVGFLSVLEGCRATSPAHLVFASTSSAYGANGALPFSPHQPANHPLTLYAATKVANESMAHAYAHLFGIPCTGLRFFTVYGPWTRPDMALYRFADAIVAGLPLDVYGQGRMQRDFTYVDDIVRGVIAALDRPATPDSRWSAESPDPATSGVAPWRILNLGAGSRVELMTYIELLSEALGRPAKLNLLPMQPGDLAFTEADISDTTAALGYAPETPVQVGVRKFADWYCDYHGVARA